MLKVYADYESIIKDGKTNTLTVLELVRFLNEQGGVLTKEQGDAVRKTLDQRVEEDNSAKCDARCGELCAMERSDMWKVYAPNPYYMGVKITVDAKTNALTVQDAKMPLKFKTLERHYQILKSVEVGDDGKPRPNSAVTLCSDASYSKLIMLFNGLLVEETATELGSNKLQRSTKVVEALTEKGLDCFTGTINKAKRLQQLQSIWNAMLPEELAKDCKALSCDVSFMKKAAFRVKGNSVNGIGDRAMVDFVVVTLAAGLSFDGKARTLKYNTTSKSKFFVSDK